MKLLRKLSFIIRTLDNEHCSCICFMLTMSSIRGESLLLLGAREGAGVFKVKSDDYTFCLPVFIQIAFYFSSEILIKIFYWYIDDLWFKIRVNGFFAMFTSKFVSRYTSVWRIQNGNNIPWLNINKLTFHKFYKCISRIYFGSNVNVVEKITTY